MNTAQTTYTICVDGHLDDHWSAWLGDLDLTRDNDGTTTLTVSNADQAQLHGVLAGLRDIGAVITELSTTYAPKSPYADEVGIAQREVSASRRAAARSPGQSKGPPISDGHASGRRWGRP